MDLAMNAALVAVAVLAARALLATVFAVAATAKLRDGEQFRRALPAFGVPAILVGPSSVLIPAIELGVAIALVSAGTSYSAALAALALLVVFSAAIAANLAGGRTPDCRCFGQLRPQPIGPGTLGRNAMFAALAAMIIVADPAYARPGLLDALSAVTGIRPAILTLGSGALALIGLQAVLQWKLLRQNGRLMVRLEALERHVGITANSLVPAHLPIGAAAPSFDLPTESGRSVSLDELRRGGLPVLLIFSDPDCHACTAFLPTVGAWEADHGTRLRIAVISRSADQAARRAGVRTVLFQREREVAEAYGVPATPGALIVRPDGTVGSAVMLGGDAIATLLPNPAMSHRTDAPSPTIEAIA